MNKFSNITLISIAVALGASLPAKASDSDDIVVKAVKVPLVVSSLVAGMAVGTPIAVLHDTMKNYSSARDDMANEFSGGEPDACQYFVADLLAVPAGIAGGLVNGVYHGVTNAVANCNEKPFSAESFCLKESCFPD